ncbi:zinc-ribbon domain-containing protein [Gemmiger sp.]|uniref:zinc-ribbon domain-containing protein n=1 Tax=Gemmiger sp. TaxID=2049027 RepID=UPI00351FCA4A
MFCTHCGQELPSDAKFCTACGAEVKAATKEEKPQLVKSRESESKVFEKQQEVPKSTAKKVWDGVVTLACFIVVVVGGVGIIGLVVSAILSL